MLFLQSSLPGIPLELKGLCGLVVWVAGLLTLLMGEFGPALCGLRWECELLKPVAEYETLWGIAGSVSCWNGRREWPGANSLWRGTRTGGSTEIAIRMRNISLEKFLRNKYLGFLPSCSGTGWCTLLSVWLRMETDTVPMALIRDDSVSPASAKLGSKWHEEALCDVKPMSNFK